MEPRLSRRSWGGGIGRRALAAAALVAVASWSAGQQCTGTQTVQPGLIVGQLRWTDAQLIRPYLDANPVVAPYWPVVAARRGWQDAARDDYVPGNTWDGDHRVAGSFDLAPDVGFGDTFELSAFFVSLRDGARYAFGSPTSGSPLGHLCSGVQPVEQDPDGRPCDMAETASLVSATVRFAGSALSRIDVAQPVSCGLWATIADSATPGEEWEQAASPMYVFPVSTVTGAGGTAQILVRAVPRIALHVSCSVAVQSPDVPCFVMEPSGSRATVGGETVIDPRTTLSSILDVPVVCTAGAVEGALDVVGHTIDRSEVWLGRTGYLAGPFQSTEPSSGTPPLQWKFRGFPSGSHAARAWSVFDDRESFLRLPAKDGPYGPVAVPVQQTTDLGNTFVTRPVAAQGDVVLSDSGTGALASLSIGPLSTSHPAPWESPWEDDPDEGTENSNSFMEATGALRQGEAYSGLEGLARAQLKGGYAPVTGRANLGYTLYLGGLSPESGAASGMSAYPTPWDVSRLHLRFAPPGGGTERIAVRLAALALPALGPSSLPVTVPTQKVCVGTAALKLQLQPSLGQLSQPGASFQSVGPFYGAGDTSPLLGAKGDASNWDDSVPPASEVTVPLTLSAGFRYQISPWVGVMLTGASSATHAYLPSLYLPPSAHLRCGDTLGTCLRLGCGNTFEEMSVEVLAADGVSAAPECLAGTSAAFTVRVKDTGGLAPVAVSYALDPSGEGCGPSPTDLCDGDCAVDPQFPVTVSGLLPGAHRLVACAGLGSDPLCAHHSASFSVLALACPPSFEVRLDPGEPDVAATDPRVAPHLVATAAGCETSSPVQDDRPDRFRPGTTVVNFGAGDAGSCQTAVTVIPSTLTVKRQGATVPGQLERFLLPGGPSTVASAIPIATGPYSDLRRGLDGAAVAGPAGLARVAFPAAGQPPASPMWHSVGLAGGPWRLAWHPTRPFLAIVGRTATDGPWAVKIVQGVQVLHTLPVPMAGANLAQTLTAIGWSPDGGRLAVAGVARSTSPGLQVSSYVVHSWGLAPVTGPTSPTTMVHPAGPGAAVHEILLRENHLLLATGQGLFRVDAAWHLVYSRSNMDMAIGPQGDAVVLAVMDPQANRARLVYRSLVGAGETREGPAVSPAKPTPTEVAITADGRFAAITSYNGTNSTTPIPIYPLGTLSATSPPVAVAVARQGAQDPQFQRSP
jgi:hypothetical protein